MSSSLAFEKALYDKYNNLFRNRMDEMKMHKLMYFTQRESLMLYGTPAFNEDFYGWRYGPVLKSVRNQFRLDPDNPYKLVKDSLSDSEESLVEDVLHRYGSYSSWRLSELSHAEYSWKRSRRGLKSFENGDVKLDLRAMKVDATKEALNRR